MRKIEIYKSESERPDQTWQLGKELTSSEERCYRIIRLNGTLPISAEEIGKIFYDDFNNETVIVMANVNSVQAMVQRIRKKIGDEEIICKIKYGYVSRRALINDMVAKNIKKNE